MTADITITGNVGAPVDFRDNEWGGRASFTLASTPRVRRKDGEWVDGRTTWYRVICWRRLAHHVAASIAKGDAVLVAGRLTHHEYLGLKGDTRTEFIIEATVVGHDLRWGTAAFARPARPEDEGPLESADDAERARDHEERLLALVGAAPDDLVGAEEEPVPPPF